MLIEYAVIAGYLVVLLAVGFVFKKLNSDDSDYFRNGCKGTWWLVGASAFMTQFSAWTFTGASGAAYQSGWSVMIIFLANAAGYAVGAIGVSAWFRQLRVITVPEAIRARFDAPTQQFYAWMGVVTGLLYASLWLYGLAIFCAATFGFPLIQVILVIGIVVLVYSTAGGSWAVMATDFLQTLILIPITLLVAYLSLRAIGGLGGLFDEIATQGLTKQFRLINEPGVHAGSNDYTLYWAAAFFLKQITTINTLTSSQRYFGVKTGWDAQKASAMAGVLMIMGALVWFIPPIVGRLLYAAEIDAMAVPKPAETAYAVVSFKLLPAGMMGLMVVAMLSATMSSLDTGLNRNAAIFVRDILPAMAKLVGVKLDPNASRLRVAQGASIGFGLAIIGLAMYFAAQEGGEGVFGLMIKVGALLALPTAIPMVWAILIRRAPAWSAFVSIACGLGMSAYGEYVAGDWSMQRAIFLNVAAASVGFLVTVPFASTATAAYREKVDAFFTNMHKPIDFAEEVGVGNDASQLKIMAWFSIIIGGFISLLVLLPNDMVGRLGILFVGGFVMVVGLALWWAGKRGEREVARLLALSPEVGHA